MIVGQNPHAMEKVLLDYFAAIAQYQDMNLRNPIKQELHEVFQNVRLPSTAPAHLRERTLTSPFQVLNVYKQMIPQFNEFIGQMRPQDQQSLKANYAI